MRISRRPTTLVFPVEDPRADSFMKNFIPSLERPKFSKGAATRHGGAARGAERAQNSRLVEKKGSNP